MSELPLTLSSRWRSARLRGAGLIAAAALALSPVLSNAAETYPSRPITLVVPFAAGGGGDSLARIWADYAGKQLGASIVVTNKDGANGIVASNYVVHQPADGYTLLMTSGSISLNVFTYQAMPYRLTDFDGVAMLGTSPQILVANVASGIRSLDDLLRMARAKPDQIAYGSGGAGNSTHLNVDQLARHYDLKLVHVPYKSAAPAMMATIGGQTQLVADAVMSAMAQTRAGKVVPLLIFGPERMAELPGVPTVHELGIRNSLEGGWFCLAAPAGTPRAVIDRLNALAKGMWQDPSSKARLDAVYMVPLPDQSPGALAAYIDRDAKVWGPVLTHLGIRNTN